MARTNTELYRRYEGELQPRALRFLPLVAAGIRTALKKKIPLLLLYRGARHRGHRLLLHRLREVLRRGDGPVHRRRRRHGGAVRPARAMVNLQVAEQIADLNHVMRLFALLTVTWYGAGLFAEDRRMGAHLLLFSRPITRLDYFLGKFLTVAFFGALAMLAPGLLVCLVAAWSSPEWSFLTEEGDTIWRTALYATVWIVVGVRRWCCACRRSPAAAPSPWPVPSASSSSTWPWGGVLGVIDPRYEALSLMRDMRKLRNWIFQVDDWRHLGFSETTAVLMLAGAVALCLLIIAARLRKLEVVA